MMKNRKTLGITAHDTKKKDILEWVKWNSQKLVECELICTGITGKLIEGLLTSEGFYNPDVVKLKTGSLGGNQQLGSLIVDGNINILFYFWDPMEIYGHDNDFKALLRVSVLYNIPTACNRSTADYLITSPLFDL